MKILKAKWNCPTNNERYDILYLPLEKCYGGSAAQVDCSRVEERRLWSALSLFIAFTRISSGRGHLKGYVSKSNSFGTRYRIMLMLIPLVIRLGMLYLLVIKIFLPSFPGYHIGYDSFFSRRLTAPPVNAGFTAVIPSCYDGDTCHSRHLQFDTNILPELFRNLNIRIMGTMFARTG